MSERPPNTIASYPPLSLGGEAQGGVHRVPPVPGLYGGPSSIRPSWRGREWPHGEDGMRVGRFMAAVRWSERLPCPPHIDPRLQKRGEAEARSLSPHYRSAPFIAACSRVARGGGEGVKGFLDAFEN